MTAKQGREMFREHKFGVLLIGLGIIGYATSFYVEDLRGKVDWAYAASVAGGAWGMWQRQGRKKNADAVAGATASSIEPLRNDVHELSMAVNRLSGTVDETRQGVARLEENGHENKRLHAETIRVTDSLAKSVDALNVAVATAVPGFIGHDIEQRKT